MYAKAKEAVSRALAALRHNREVQKRISEERFAALEAKSAPYFFFIFFITLKPRVE